MGLRVQALFAAAYAAAQSPALQPVAATTDPTAFAAAAHTTTFVTTTSLAPAPIAASFSAAVTAQCTLPKDGRGARSTRSSPGALPHWPGAPEPDQAASYAST